MLDGGNVLNNKVSTHIQTQLPEFIQADHPLFSQFVKAYYQFMESAEITFSETNNYVRQETQSVNFLLDENDDQIVLEDSESKFTVGEILTGQTSGATATILVDDVDNNKRLFVTSQNQFILGENVSGNISNSSGTILTYRPNPVSSIQQLLNHTNVDSTIFQFLDNFRDAFLEGVVDNLADGVDKRKLIKNIRDLYISKGTKKGHELFFRLLLNEEAVIEYPTDQMLRVSDGKWTVKNIMRAQPVNGSTSELIGQTITGQTSSATAIIVSSVSFREANKDVLEIELDPSTITGTFQEGETVVGVSTVSDQTVSFLTYGILTGLSVSNNGAYYTADQTVNLSATGSETATAKVQTVSRGIVDEIVIDDAGQNYKVGDNLTLDNSNTDGTGAAAQVSVVGGGVAPESGSITEYGMEEDDHITLEPTSQAFYSDTYEGIKIVMETGTFANLSVASEAGEITDVRMVAKGAGYSKLPVVTSITTANGSGAKLLAASSSGIGGVESFGITNQGIDYTSVPTIIPFRHAIIKDITGTFVVGDTLTIPEGISLEDNSGDIDLETATGTGLLLTEETLSGSVTAFDSSRQLISINTTANLEKNNTIAVGGSKSGTIANISTASGTAQVGQIAITDGNFITSDGQVSEVNTRIQDSFYYQDYSYVVRVGESINTWRDSIKSTVHPAGWAVFGQVDVVGRANARITPQTVESFTPELASELKGIFTTVFGRRLGTVDDSTALKATPQVGSDNLTSFPNTNRDLTLERINTIFVGTARTTDKSHGHTLDSLPKYAFGIGGTTTESIPNYPSLIRTQSLDGINDQSFTIGQFANFRINEVSDSNGNIPLEAFKTKINVPPPGEIQISGTARANAFDNNFITFDSSTETFDESVLTTNFSSTSLKFDSSSVKFDGAGGISVPRDTSGQYNVDFSDTTTSFDSSINKFDASHNPLVLERFSSLNFKFDNTNKTFDIGA